MTLKKSEAIRLAVDRYLASEMFNGESKFLTLPYVLSDVLSLEEVKQLNSDEFELLKGVEGSENRQAVLFMYAEFLALLAEDEEAAEEKLRAEIEELFNEP